MNKKLGHNATQFDMKAQYRSPLNREFEQQEYALSLLASWLVKAVIHQSGIEVDSSPSAITSAHPALTSAPNHSTVGTPTYSKYGFSEK